MPRARRRPFPSLAGCEAYPPAPAGAGSSPRRWSGAGPGTGRWRSLYSQCSAITSVASKLGCTAQTLRKWVRQAERDRGVRAGLRSDERERFKALERAVRELRRANESLRKASAYSSTFGRRQHRRSPRRSSTAAREDDVVHRHSSESMRGRADSCASTARPIDVLRAQGARSAAGARAGACAPRRVAERGDRPGVRRALPGVRGAQGVASDSPRTAPANGSSPLARGTPSRLLM